MAIARRKAHLAAGMYLGASALALPAGAALALAVARGPDVLSGEGAVSFVVLAVTGIAGIAGAAAAAARERRRRDPAVPRPVEALLGGIASALGDAALAFDAQGRLAWANDAALALCGQPREALAGRSRDVLGNDVAVLLRGLARGASAGRVVLATPAGKIVARAAAVRITLGSPVDVLALRIEPRDEAEPRPVDDADIVREPDAGPGEPASPRLAAPALAAEIGAPLARASQAASLLRLALPPGCAGAGPQLARLEEALSRAEERVALLANTGGASDVRAPVDLDVLVSDVLAGIALARGVRIRRVRAAAPARGDPGALRLALRHVLRTAAAAMPAGGELMIRASVRGGEAAVEIADTGVANTATMELAAAEHLLATQGGRLEHVAIPGRGAICRVVLPADAAGRATASGGSFDSSAAPR
jgi:signal transduction histidine kinase